MCRCTYVPVRECVSVRLFLHVYLLQCVYALLCVCMCMFMCVFVCVLLSVYIFVGVCVVNLYKMSPCVLSVGMCAR